MEKEKLYKDPGWLSYQYLTEGRSIRHIADIAGVDHKTIHYYLKKFHIRRRKSKRKQDSKICISIPDFILERLKKIARERRTTLTRTITEIALLYLAEKRKRDGGKGEI